jgi:hypothetical protein
MPGKMARSDPRPSVRITRGAGSGQHLASVLPEGQKTRTLMPVWDSSGESRLIELGTKMTRDIGQDYDCEGELKVNYDDSPDRDQAGNGLTLFPLINQSLGTPKLLDWAMSPSEKVALIFLLEHLRPKVAIEIGTYKGGSLQVLSQFCHRVYSIDVDPDIPRRLEGKFPNVEYLIGPSDQLLPPLIDRLAEEGAELSFALVDGDHSAEGVRKDIDNLLRFRPIVPLYIVMHDSFNPQCRLGLIQAHWSANRYVHAVELDFVAGTVNSAPNFRNQLWGGFALGILLPHERRGRFEITGRAERTRKAAMFSPEIRFKQFTGRAKRTLPGRVAVKAKRMLIG